jgi:DNA-binding response OmpR family regulator
MTTCLEAKARRPDVLIVEDNDDGRESLRELLSLSGLDVAVAADGGEGVRKGTALRPRAAVVDIGLPVLDGFAVCRELRRALGEEVLLIAHTAYGSEEPVRKAREAGFDCLVRKPCDFAELARLVCQVPR